MSITTLLMAMKVAVNYRKNVEGQTDNDNQNDCFHHNSFRLGAPSAIKHVNQPQVS